MYLKWKSFVFQPPCAKPKCKFNGVKDSMKDRSNFLRAKKNGVLTAHTTPVLPVIYHTVSFYVITGKIV